MDFSAIYPEHNRTGFLLPAVILIVVTSVVDWKTKPHTSVELVASLPPRWRITLVALLRAVVQGFFRQLSSDEAVTRPLMASSGFVETAFFVPVVIRNRRATLEHLKRVET